MGRHDEGVARAVLSRLRERATARPLPPGPLLAECDPDPARVIRLWENAQPAVVPEPACARPSRIHRLVLDGAAPWRAGTTHPHGLRSVVSLARALGRLPGHLVAYAVDVADISLGHGPSGPVAATVGQPAERGAAARGTADGPRARASGRGSTLFSRIPMARCTAASPTPSARCVTPSTASTAPRAGRPSPRPPSRGE